MSEDTNPNPTCVLCGARLTWFSDSPTEGWWVDVLWNVDSDPTDHVHRTGETVPASHLIVRDVVAVNIAESPLALAKWRPLTLFHIVPVGDDHLQLWFIDYTGETAVGEHHYTVHSNCAVRVIDDVE